MIYELPRWTIPAVLTLRQMLAMTKASSIPAADNEMKINPFNGPAEKLSNASSQI